ncbi:uncharacterized protein [Medicago truncatula]|uniref:uncharacterized protein n=1 Tax=Medicago truncatula TaxID=3880 RepID=UPI001966CF16|nr:uncharacterized protein LOC112420928 [Medicago truncatula]
MSNLSKLHFEALKISGHNYLTWAVDAEMYLAAEGNVDAIKEGNKASEQQKAKALIFLRHHINEALKNEYLTVKDPLVLWNKLKDRYEHLKAIILPKARYDWMHLRLQDYKSVTAYNSEVYKITSQLELCGEKVTDADLLEKTFSTFHASNMLLQQQYREKGFQKYSDLISCLLVAEQNNELLMKNHEARPAGVAPFPEANASQHNHFGEARGRGRGHGRGRGRGHSHNPNGKFKTPFFHQKWKNNEKIEKEKGGQNSKTNENICYRCGGKGHWSRTCRTPKHLVDLYQQSLKNKGKKVETHYAYNDGDDADYDIYGDLDTTPLDIGDFFEDPNEKIDHLIGDGTVKK